MRPCAGSQRRGDARTGTDGGVRRLRLYAPVRAFIAVDLRRSRCHFTVAACLVPRFWLGVLGAEGVSDALVRGIGLAVDAVGVDLQQDRDAVPSAARDFGGGHPGVEPQRNGGVPQVVGAAAERGAVLRLGDAIAVDGTHVWVANSGGSVTELHTGCTLDSAPPVKPKPAPPRPRTWQSQRLHDRA